MGTKTILDLFDSGTIEQVRGIIRGETWGGNHHKLLAQIGERLLTPGVPFEWRGYWDAVRPVCMPDTTAPPSQLRCAVFAGIFGTVLFLCTREVQGTAGVVIREDQNFHVIPFDETVDRCTSSISIIENKMGQVEIRYIYAEISCPREGSNSQDVFEPDESARMVEWLNYYLPVS